MLALGLGWLSAGGGRFQPDGWADVFMAAAVAACWHVWLAVCAGVPWADLTSESRRLDATQQAGRLPFTEPGSAADRLSETLGRLVTWLRLSAWPRYGDAGVFGAFAASISLALALSIRPAAVLLSLAVIGLGVLLIVVAARSADGAAARDWVAALRGLGAVAIPLCMGWMLVKDLTATHVIAATLLGLAYRPARPSAFNATYVALLALMLVDRHSLGAYLLALLWLPHFLLQAALPSAERTRASTLWFAASVLVAVLAIG